MKRRTSTFLFIKFKNTSVIIFTLHVSLLWHIEVVPCQVQMTELLLSEPGLQMKFIWPQSPCSFHVLCQASLQEQLAGFCSGSLGPRQAGLSLQVALKPSLALNCQDVLGRYSASDLCPCFRSLRIPWEVLVAGHWGTRMVFLRWFSLQVKVTQSRLDFTVCQPGNRQWTGPSADAASDQRGITQLQEPGTLLFPLWTPLKAVALRKEKVQI